MTAILALRRQGQTWLASDGYTFLDNLSLETGPKFIRADWLEPGCRFALAHSWSARAAQLIERNLRDFKAPVRWTDAEAHQLANWVKELMEKHGGKKEAAAEDKLPSHPIGLILASRDGLYRISGDGCALRCARFVAMGAGEQYVYGALDALWADLRITPRELAERAISTAKKYCPWVRGKTHVLRVAS